MELMGSMNCPFTQFSYVAGMNRESTLVIRRVVVAVVALRAGGLGRMRAESG